MKKKLGVLFLSVLCAVSMCASAVFAFADTQADEPAYFISSGNLVYGQYNESAENNWNSAPGDSSVYIAKDNIMNPGAIYQTAICFTFPVSGTVTPRNNRIGLVKATQNPSSNGYNGDGVRFSVFINNEKIYPTDTLWKQAPYVPDGQDDVNADILIADAFSVSQGDKLYLIIENGGNGNADWDSVYAFLGFDFTGGGYDDWLDTSEFFYTNDTEGDVQHALGFAKKDVVSYRYVTVKELVETPDVTTDGKEIRATLGAFTYGEVNPEKDNGEGNDKGTGTFAWTGLTNQADVNCYIDDGKVFSPGGTYAVAVVFTAPCDGTISNALGGGTVYRSGEVHDGTEANQPATDKTRISISFNNEIVYPYTGLWADIPQGSENKLNILFNTLTVSAGDKLVYVIDNGGNGNAQWDTNVLEAGFLWKDTQHPKGIYVNFVENSWETASEGDSSVTFGNYLRKNVFSYHYTTVKELVETPDVTTDGKEIRTTLNPFVFAEVNPEANNGEGTGTFAWTHSSENVMYSEQYSYIDDGKIFSPGGNYAVAVAFTAPCDGTISNALGGGTVYRSGEVHDGSGAEAATDPTRISISLNDTVVYPFTGVWKEVPQGSENKLNIVFNTLTVSAGDKLVYVVDNGGNANSMWDTTVLEAGFLWKDANNSDGVYVNFMDNYWEETEDGDSNVTFGEYLKKNVFTYHYVAVNECNPVGDAVALTTQAVPETFSTQELTYSETAKKYYDRSDPNILAMAEYCDTGIGFSLGVEWTAPEAGRVDLSTSYVSNYAFRTEADKGGIRSDGIRFRIVLNDTSIIYPSDNTWLTITNDDKYVLDIDPFAVAKGDKLMFVLDRNEESNYDTSSMNIVIDFAKDGETYTDTYDRVKNFRQDDQFGKSWKYYLIAFETEEESVNIEPLKVIPYGGVAGCGSSFVGGNLFMVVVTIGAVAVVLSVKKLRRKSK